MTISPITVFNATLLPACAYAIWRGGAPERAGAALLLLAAAGSAIITLDPSTSFTAIEPWIFWVDTGLFLALVALTGVANRYWPMWLAAMQLVTVATHGIRAFDSRVWALAYWLVSSYMAYLLILFLVIGASRHHRRLIAGFPERAWSWAARTGHGGSERGGRVAGARTDPFCYADGGSDRAS